MTKEESLRETIERSLGESTQYDEELHGVSDRAAAILAAAFFEAKLRTAIACMFARRNGEVADRVDSGERVFANGHDPLRNLSSEIEIGWALGLYDLGDKRRLHIVRRIRNESAHAAKPICFADEPVANWCRDLTEGAHREESLRGAYVSVLKRLEGQMHVVIVSI